MNEIILLGMPGGWEWIVILVVIMLLFGGSRLPQLAKALGQSKRAFREGIQDGEDEAEREREEKQFAAGKRAALKPLDEMSDEEIAAEARRREQQRAGK